MPAVYSVSEGVRVVTIPAPGRDRRFGGNVEAHSVIQYIENFDNQGCSSCCCCELFMSSVACGWFRGPPLLRREPSSVR